jgi:hypothetical protein
MGQEEKRKRVPTFEKAWRKGHDYLAQRDLLKLNPQYKGRSVVGSINNAGDIKSGDVVVLQATNDGLVICKGGAEVGVASSPPPDLSTAIAEAGGYAEATVGDVHDFSGTADFLVKSSDQ